MSTSTPKNPLALVTAIITLALAVACGSPATQVPSPNTTPQATSARVQGQTPVPPATPSPTLTPSSSPQSQGVKLERVFESLSFRRLTNLVQAGGRFFVTEQAGRVISLPGGSNASEASVFLDIRDQVNDAGNEEGLLGLAFDPRFGSNGHFYVYYSAADPRRSVVSRFTAAVPNAATAAPESELVVLEIPQPFQNHNGGQLAFGPDDMLYIGLGDGGSGGDPDGNGQDTSTLLGSILRIDVSGLGPNQGYRVPPDNPFVAIPGARDQIWAYGLRNPWRFSFDQRNGGLWVGDVGQNSYEEVNLVLRGGNYGWNILEGAHCFSPRAGCDRSGTELPVIEYGSDQGCSVIGGYVYRGTAIPSLAGTYLYGDYCSGEIHGFRFMNGEVAEHRLLIDSGLRITSFGEDEKGEIYVLSQDGAIYLLKAES